MVLQKQKKRIQTYEHFSINPVVSLYVLECCFSINPVVSLYVYQYMCVCF